ncbi:Mini zinc finger protein 1 [Sesamum alatum]|uniref:Mini zinc finger protein 1 n=1 Tax=Sesamum alatum TaxID=300844 RepID=A0AAE2CAG5_9LAMI|nr:Mini zinc finger protein 1 [Sesamum alatum]
MAYTYFECHNPHLSGKIDGCQEYGESWDSNCRFCGCHRSFYRKVVTPVKFKTEVVYTKCHKIHEFNLQNSVDGCQEFIPAGEDGTATALNCVICGCHKSFHRNEVTIEVTSPYE